MNAQHQPNAPAETDPHAWLSALADGDADAAPHACGLWRDDEEARRRWHAYHLIGDVMRSEELAGAPARDAAFLAGVRARLAAEPVVLAPAPAAPPARRRQPWLVPAAAAAGFAVVTGALMASRTPWAGASSSVVASGASDAAVVAAPMPQQAPPPLMVRDARLDEYTRVHEAARRGVVIASPGGSLLHPVAATASPER